MEVTTVPIGSIDLDPANVRTHDTRNIKAIKDSLTQFGQRKPIVVMRGGGDRFTVIAGNGTLEAARELEWSDIAVAVAPEDWTSDEAAAFAIADNRTAELAEWDKAGLEMQLKELEAAGWEMETLGFEPPDKTADDVVEDEVPEVPDEPVTKLGDLWILGEHRLLCGDSTTGESFQKLMGGQLADLIVTDPPYGVSYTGGQNEKKREMLSNDDKDVFSASIPLGNTYSKPDAALYVWFAGSKGHLAFNSVMSSGYDVRAMIFWHKLKAHYGSYMSQYMPKHEPMLYCHKSGKSPKWRGPTNEVTVWEYDQPSQNEYHPTQKPVSVMARAIQNSSDSGDIVLDYFAGSGTTLIASEQTGRIAHLIELDPAYCDVIVKRWETFTGQTAELLTT